MNFSTATEHCRSMDAYLAEPRSEEEYDIFVKFARNLGIHNFWLGATDSANEGTYVWQSDGQVLSYEDWHPAETNQEDKDCSYMHSSDGTWTYYNCNSKIYCICQKKFGGNVIFLLSSSLKKHHFHIKHNYFNHT